MSSAARQVKANRYTTVRHPEDVDMNTMEQSWTCEGTTPPEFTAALMFAARRHYGENALAPAATASAAKQGQAALVDVGAVPLPPASVAIAAHTTEVPTRASAATSGGAGAAAGPPPLGGPGEKCDGTPPLGSPAEKTPACGAAACSFEEIEAPIWNKLFSKQASTCDPTWPDLADETCGRTSEV